MFEVERLNQTLQQLGLGPDVELFERLKASYQALDRYYHSDSHIVDCLSKLDVFSISARPRAEIELAIWFHDVVYDSRKPDNEEQSGEWARSYLSSHNFDQDSRRRIVDLILATKSHRSSNRQQEILIDIDLSILGAPQAEFEAYDQAIRQEYAWVPESDYRKGRAQVLSKFLDRPRIFQTDEMHQRYEEQAKSNLRRKLAELTAA